MTHCFKIPLQLSDMFVYSITDNQIVYEVRDKSTGGLLEPRKTSVYDVAEGKIHFDNRFIAVGLASVVMGTLQ